MSNNSTPLRQHLSKLYHFFSLFKSVFEMGQAKIGTIRAYAQAPGGTCGI
jgi:hypothetical protein